ncbi:unnamed protein product, partial [Closterium sp. NIES-54]
TVDYGGVGAGGASSGGAGVGGIDAGGASSEGAGAEGVGAGGTSSEGARAEATGIGGAHSGGTRAGGAGTGSASSGGGRPGDTSSWGAGAGGSSSEKIGAGGIATRDYELHSLDFSTAFLQGSLHEEIWLRRPPGFIGTFPPGTEWSLRRPVYGLRQAPHQWHDMLCTTLAALGFRPSSADPSLFILSGPTSFFVLVYVDDLVFATADMTTLAKVKSELQKRHTCTYLGELRRYLGLHITRDIAARTITLTNSHMVRQVLQQFGLQHSTTQPTPLAVDHKITGSFHDEPFESSGPYAKLVGCL